MKHTIFLLLAALLALPVPSRGQERSQLLTPASSRTVSEPSDPPTASAMIFASSNQPARATRRRRWRR
jgi:hypothetical protein